MTARRRAGVACGWFLAALLGGARGLGAQQTGGERPSVVPSLDGAWDSTVAVLLDQDLWSDSTAYNAGEFLMIPLHAAFERGRASWQREFASQFARFAAAGFATPTTGANRLARFQYLYLATEFMTLAGGSGHADLVPPSLPDMVSGAVVDAWQRDTVSAWGHPFPGGIRSRVDWKLGTEEAMPRFHRAIDDLECFVFAVGADLRRYAALTGSHEADSLVLTDVLTHARRVFQQRVAWQPDGGWLFQPGVWSDHPDFAYAGQTAKVPGMPKSPVADVAEDVSHSFRYPLWLRSLRDAYAAADVEWTYYDSLRLGLARQFLNHVLVPPSPQYPYYRLTTFMDGRNGVYRWDYHGRTGRGAGPYELSGSLTLGWWAFLNTSGVRAVYNDLAARFPLAPAVEQFYAQGTPAKDTHDPRRVIAESWTDGLRGLIVRLAARLGS